LTSPSRSIMRSYSFEDEAIVLSLRIESFQLVYSENKQHYPQNLKCESSLVDEGANNPHILKFDLW